MPIVDIDPSDVRVEDLWIPMSDGVRLHARAWMPTTIPAGGSPVLLEYLPYRLDDWTSVRDSERHPYYAAHGYISVRVDIRGTGSSQGYFSDEYSSQEIHDGASVVEWLAGQDFCSGKVGMFGISWGGFNSLQIAQERPEGLAAIVTVCSTDDRFDNDVHYIGGAVLAVDMTAWAGTMLAFASRPPRPEVVGEDWVELWRDRLEHQRPLGPTWLSHQERDEYWRRGSVCEDYDGIDAAVLAVGGWADPYRDTVLRLLENLSAPAKGIIGPWPHQYPDRELAPGPRIGFLQETLRWWDYHLKGVSNGVMDEPKLRAWITDQEKPATYIPERIGHWVGQDWPTRPDQGEDITLGLGSETVIVDSPEGTGQDAGRFFPFGNETDLPPDQRAEDGRSRCIDIELDEDLVLLGRAKLRLRLSSTTKRANVIVRLCDVAPDGSSTLVTRGVLNLLKRDGMDKNSELPVSEAIDATVLLKASGYRFAAGHKLRIAISNQYWPWVWPHGERGNLSVDLSQSQLRIPTVASDAVQVAFADPEFARPIEIGVPTQLGHSKDRPQRLVTFDVAQQLTRVIVDPGYGGTRVYPDGLTFLEDAEETYEIREEDPTSAKATSSWRIEMIKDDWRALIRTRAIVTCDENKFYLTNRIETQATVAGETIQVFTNEYLDEIVRTSA